MTRAQRIRAGLTSMYETEAAGKRVLAMEGLRGFAMLLVFICHYKIVVLERLSPQYDSTLFRTIVQVAASGLDLFFLLSGMLIYRLALNSRLHVGRFWWRRIQRIYPTFLVAFLIYFVVSVFLHQGPQRLPADAGSAAGYLALNILLLPGVVDMRPLIPAAWSLSYELCFYMSLPLIAVALRIWRWTRTQRCALWLSLIAIHQVYVLLLPQTLPAYRYQDNNFLRFDMFLAGMMLYEFMNSSGFPRWMTPERQKILLWLSAVTAIVYCYLVFVNVNILHHPIQHALTRIAMVGFIWISLMLATLTDNGVLKSYFSYTWLRWVGNISFSLYLIHGMVLNAVIAVALLVPGVSAHSVAAAVVLLPLSLLATFLASTLLFITVEKPFSIKPHSRKAMAPVKRMGEKAGERASELAKV